MKWRLLLLLLVTFVKTGRTQAEKVIRITHQQMGTQWQIQIYSDQLNAEQLAPPLRNLIDSLNSLYSDYDPQSELNRVVERAQAGYWQPLSPALYEILQEAQYFAKRTNGAFDVSIGPLSKLWRRAFRRQVFPERESIRKAQSKVNYRWVKLRKGQLRLKRPGMQLDLGGIAKGKAVDILAQYLDQLGIEVYLIDGGGDLRVQGSPPGRENWKIALPDGSDLEIQKGAVATSGATYRYLEHDGKRYSHLIDPRTGYGVQGHRVVTVRAPTAMQADAWASAFSILGGKKAGQLQKQLAETIQVFYY